MVKASRFLTHMKRLRDPDEPTLGFGLRPIGASPQHPVGSRVDSTNVTLLIILSCLRGGASRWVDRCFMSLCRQR